MSWQCELAVWSVGWQCELAVWQSAADDAPKVIERELFDLGADVAATTEAGDLKTQPGSSLNWALAGRLASGSPCGQLGPT